MFEVEILERIARLEALFEEVKQQKGIPGPRGPAGSIEAAAENARQAVCDAEARVQAKANQAYEKFTAEIKKLRQEVDGAKQFMDERIHNTVEAHSVQVLQDYRLINEKGEPTHWNKNNARCRNYSDA